MMDTTTTSQERQSFHYKSLLGTDIRVLVICPSHTKSSPVLCSLLHRPLESCTESVIENPPPYEALSYAWGPNSGAHSIWLSNHEDPAHAQKEISVTDNLYDALVSLRLADRQRYIWVDALCINQDDDAEKDGQILRMLRIYQSAERLVIWLGNEVETTDAAMQHLDNLKERWERRQRNTRFEILLAGYEIGLAFVGLWAFLVLCLVLLVRHQLFLSAGLCFGWYIIFTKALSSPLLGLMILVWRQMYLSAVLYSAWHHIFPEALGNAWTAWITYLPLFGCQIRRSVWLLLQLPTTFIKARQLLLKIPAGVETPEDDILDGLTDFFSRSWFTRIWIIQEASTADDNTLVVCGSRQTTWNTLVAACSELQALNKGWRKSPYGRTGYQQVCHVLDSLRLDGLSPSDPFIERRLLTLLCRFHTQEAKLLHDKVYALLGMSVEIQDQEKKAAVHLSSTSFTPFIPNSKEPVEITYCRTAKFLIESSGSLRVFRACMGDKTLEGLPSWVPDWSTPCWRNLDDLAAPHFPSLYHAVNQPNRGSVAKISDDLKTVTVRGIIFGSLCSGPVYSDIPTGQDARFLMQIYLRISIALSWLLTSPRTWDLLIVLWRFFLHGFGASGPEIAQSWQIYELIRDTFVSPVTMSMVKALQLQFNEDDVPAAFHMKGRFAQFDAEFNFRIFDGGKFTVSTFVKNPRDGDTIVLLEGADIPFLLRPRDMSGERWEMIGPAVLNSPIDRAFWRRYVGCDMEGGVELREFVLD